MFRYAFCVITLTGLIKGQGLLTSANAQPLLPGPIRISESKPVTVNGVSFVVVAQTDWVPAKPRTPFDQFMKFNAAPIEIQLRMTNLTRNGVIFPSSSSFGVKVFDLAGKEIAPREICKGARLTRPISISRGESFSLWRIAELHWHEKTKTSDLVCFDGTGSQSVIGPIINGQYKLAFWYSSKDKQNVGNEATWVGEVTTDDVVVEVVEPTTDGGPSLEGSLKVLTKSLKPSSDVLHIRVSEPITVNGAKFAIVAQSNWKIGSQKVPIPIQLHITNLGKTAMLFDTFDSFVLGMKNSDGKRILAGGGRNATCFTRPVLIPKGGSYAICRKAELGWNAETEANELAYWDGTGTVLRFGPLHPGSYKLGFAYGVTRNPLLRPKEKVVDLPRWMGDLATRDILVEVEAR